MLTRQKFGKYYLSNKKLIKYLKLSKYQSEIVIIEQFVVLTTYESDL